MPLVGGECSAALGADAEAGVRGVAVRPARTEAWPQKMHGEGSVVAGDLLLPPESGRGSEMQLAAEPGTEKPSAPARRFAASALQHTCRTRSDLRTFAGWNHPWFTSPVSGPEHGDDVPVASSGSVVTTQEAGGATFGPSAKAISAAQEQSNWCWAAATQIIRRCVGLPERRQCEIAAIRLGKPCCAAPATCNDRAPFDQLTNLLAENGLSSRRERGQLDKQRFMEELYARRPVLLADQFEDNGGHVRVAFGFQEVERGALRGTLIVRMLDPARAKAASIPFEELQRSWWRETWYRIEVLDGAI